MREVSSLYEQSLEDSRDTCIRLLWTGGWDSTFRVLYSSIVDGKRVEPHYIIDTARPSSLRELETISHIKSLLRSTNEEAYERVSSLQITSIKEIPDDIGIKNSWNQLKQRAHLGQQYDWLARYAKFKNLADLELSVHIDDKAYVFLKGNVEETPFGGYRLKRNVLGDENIFARFKFPILEYSKLHMRDIARTHGFIGILEASWFCHQSTNRTPCGWCNPCRYTIEEGMRYRLPREALFRYHTYRYAKAIGSPFLKVKALRQAYDFLRYGSKS